MAVLSLFCRDLKKGTPLEGALSWILQPRKIQREIYCKSFKISTQDLNFIVGYFHRLSFAYGDSARVESVTQHVDRLYLENESLACIMLFRWYMPVHIILDPQLRTQAKEIWTALNRAPTVDDLEAARKRLSCAPAEVQMAILEESLRYWRQNGRVGWYENPFDDESYG